MKILFITSTLPRFTDDGQAPFVLEQAISWKTRFRDDKVFVLAPHDVQARKAEAIDGVQIRRFGYWWPASWQKLAYPAILPNLQKNILLIVQLPALMLCEYLAARRLVKGEGFDLIFAHWIMPQGLVAYLIHKIYGVPYGLKNYSSDLRVFEKIPFFGPALARRIIRSSVRLICENSKLRTEALAYFSPAERKDYEERVVALTMGVFHGSARPPVIASDSGRYDFAFIGRLSRKKGIDAFIRALAALKDDGVPVTVQIAGSGEEEKSLKQLCRMPEVEFTGHVSQDRKLELFRQARFFVFPSCPARGDIEGLPVALLEALYMGKIVIASKATNIELLPEWPELRDRIYLLDDPYSVAEFTGLLRKLLALESPVIDRIVAQTQSVTSSFGWDKRIERYRQLLVGVDPAT